MREFCDTSLTIGIIIYQVQNIVNIENYGGEKHSSHKNNTILDTLDFNKRINRGTPIDVYSRGKPQMCVKGSKNIFQGKKGCPTVKYGSTKFFQQTREFIE